MIVAIVLAAGAGRRFGGPKQLAAFRGRPLLAHALRAAAASPVDDIVVVLGSHADVIAAAVDLGRARAVRCERWREGQAASLRAGLEAAPDAEAAIVLLGDQPLVSTDAVRRVIESRGADVDAVRAAYGGVPAHPVLIEQRLFHRLLALDGDRGARDVLPSVAHRLVACDGVGRPDDVDTPRALADLEHGWQQQSPLASSD